MDDRHNLRGRKGLLIVDDQAFTDLPEEYLPPPAERRWAAVPSEEAWERAARAKAWRLRLYAVSVVLAVAAVAFLVWATNADAGTLERSIEWTIGRHIGNGIAGFGPWGIALAVAFIFLSRRRRRR